MLFEKRSEQISMTVLFLVILFLPLFMNLDSYYIEKLSTVMILAIFVVSLDFMVGRVGLVSLGHALFYGLGGYIFVIIAPEYEVVNFWIYSFYIMVIASLTALLVGAIVLRTQGVYFIMITLAIAQMGFYFIRDSSYLGGSDGLFIMLKPETGFFGIKFFDLDNKVHFYYFTLLSLVNTVLFFKMVLRSKFGRILEALRQNPQRTESLGYNIYLFRLLSYVVSSSLAAYAGYLFALQYGFVNPTFLSWETSGTALVMSILGGLGTIYGAVFGTFAYELLHHLFEHFTEDWMLLMGLSILLMVLLLRKGIAGYLEKLLER
ncbi:MAG: branched-chain amino acid ABC transporter permease [Gammaproteobacteria bacterium]|nr:branched-chain amino acid ABC transporter permease [Gammaproteobacteria bacterium]